MSKKIVNIKSLRPISDIKRVYSGRPGCACGCRGTYYPSKESKPTKKDLSMFKRIQKIFQENLPNVYTWEDYKDQFIALDTSETRTYTIYYKDWFLMKKFEFEILTGNQIKEDDEYYKLVH